MKQRIGICILIFLMLFTNTVCIAYADDSFDSKLTVFLAGDVIERVQVSLVFENNNPIVFAVPCSMTNYNIKYDEKDFLFDFISFEDYSLCVVAPIGKTYNFNIDISNEHNEIYEGISLKGTVINGEYEMHLTIPIIERESQWEHYVYQFGAYSIIQVYPFSSITYSEDGRKVLTEEPAGEELLLPIPTEKKDNIVYAYSMARTVQEESSSAILIITSIIFPLFICFFQLLYPEDNNQKVLSKRNILLYLIVISLIGFAIYLCATEDVPRWVFAATILASVFCSGCIIFKIVPIIAERKKNASKSNVKNEEQITEASTSQEDADNSKGE